MLVFLFTLLRAANDKGLATAGPPRHNLPMQRVGATKFEMKIK